MVLNSSARNGGQVGWEPMLTSLFVIVFSIAELSLNILGTLGEFISCLLFPKCAHYVVIIVTYFFKKNLSTMFSQGTGICTCFIKKRKTPGQSGIMNILLAFCHLLCILIYMSWPGSYEWVVEEEQEEQGRKKCRWWQRGQGKGILEF